MPTATSSASPAPAKALSRARPSRSGSEGASSSASAAFSMTRRSSVSSTSCSLSSTGSAFQQDGDQDDQGKHVSIDHDPRQRFLFSKLGALVDKGVMDSKGSRQLGVRMPLQDTKLVDSVFMTSKDLERAKLGEDVYYSAPKHRLYSKDTFESKKAKSVRRAAPPVELSGKMERPLKHAYIYHSFFECACRKGGRQEAILKVELSADAEALLPRGSLPGSKRLFPDSASVMRIRDRASTETKLLHPAEVNGGLDDFKRGQGLWYSARLEQYFSEAYVKTNMRSEAEYKAFLAKPARVHTHG